MAEQQTPTYESLQDDSQFLTAAYHTLQGLGIPTSKEPQDVLDTFLTHRRYFDTNIGSTLYQGNKIMDLPDHYKRAYSFAVDQTEKMPNFYEEGGAPMSDSLIDYGIAGVTDPTNLVSILAGFFTAGGGSAVGFGAKEVVKRGIMSRLKAAIGKKALIDKGLWKAYATEGAIAGAGGATQNVGSQIVDMDIGRREKGDINLAEVGIQASLEGTLSPLAGAGLRVVGGSIKDSLSGLAKLLGDNEIVGNAGRWIKNRFLPSSSLDEVSQRIIERNTGEMRPIQQAVEKLSLDIEDTFKRDFDGTPESKDILNLAMEGDKRALQSVSEISEDMGTHLTTWFDYVKQAQEIAGSAKYGSQYVKGIYKYDPDKLYARDVFEKFTKISREDFDTFINKKENSDLIPQLRSLIASNKDVAKEAGFLDRHGKPIKLSPKRTEELVEKFAKRLYDPIGSVQRRKLGVLKQKEDLPAVIRKLYGYNYDPAVRAMETVRGIVDSSSQLRLASSLVDSLKNRGKIIKAGNILEAESISGEEMVPYLSGLDPTTGKPLNENAVFGIRSGGDGKSLVAPELNDLFVTKSEAAKLKVMTDEMNRFSSEEGFLKDITDVASAVQGYLKKNVTVYNPLAHIRNFLGMAQYTLNTGNGAGIIDGMKFLRDTAGDPLRRKETLDSINKLGLTGSQVELNQILNRINDLNRIKDPNKLKNSAVNILTGFTPAIEDVLSKTKLGRKAVRGAQEVYAGTDDLGKVLSFFRERKRSGNIWDEMTDQRRNELRKNYADSFGEEVVLSDASPKVLKAFDNKVLDEMAVEKVMNIVPIYSRIPKILEYMRGIPIIGSFTAFPAENMRNKYKLFELAGNEIREGYETGNKALIKAGSNRLLSQLGVASAPSVVAYTYNKLNGTEGVADALNESLPEWEKDHALVVRQDKKGNYRYTDLSYNNPDQYVLDFIMPFMNDVARGRDVKESLHEVFPQIISQQMKVFTDPSMAAQLLPIASELTNAFEGSPKDMAEALTKFYKLQETGLGRMTRETLDDLGRSELINDLTKPLGLGTPASDWEAQLNKLYYGDERYRFNDSEDLAEWFAKHGLNTVHGLAATPFTLASKERKFNPKKQLAFTIKGLMRNPTRDYNDTVSTFTSSLQDPITMMSPSDVATQYEDVLDSQFSAMKGINELIISYRRFTNPSQLNTFLLSDKDIRGSLSQLQIRNLINGKFIPKKLSHNREFLRKIKKANPGMSTTKLKNILAMVERRFNGLDIETDLEPIEYNEE